MKQNETKKRSMGELFPVGLLFFFLVYSIQNISFTSLVGHSGAEVYGHAWTHWWRFQDFPAQFLGTDWTLGTNNFPPIDIAPSLFSSIIASFSTTAFGYNSCVFLSILLAIVGGFFLSKEESGDPLVGALVLAFSPIFIGTLYSGLTEDFTIGLLALGLVCFKRKSIYGSIILALIGFCGLVLGWLSGLLVLLFAAREIFQSKQRNRLFVYYIFWLFIVLILISPLFYIHWDRLHSIGHRFGTHQLGYEPFWAVNPWKQVDMVSFFHVGKVPIHNEIIRVHPSYLGLSLIAVSLFAKDRFWWFVFLLFSLFSLGEEFRFMGNTTSIPNPFFVVLQLFPGASLLNHKARLLLIALIAWTVLVSKGAKQLHTRFPKYKNIVILTLGCDLFFFSPISIQIPKMPDISQTIVSEIPSTEGYLLRLPMIGKEISFQEPLWEQTIHKQQLFMNPNRPGIKSFILHKDKYQWIETLAFNSVSEEEYFCVPSKINGVLVKEPYASHLRQKWGVPILQGEYYSYWQRTDSHCFVSNE